MVGSAMYLHSSFPRARRRRKRQAYRPSRLRVPRGVFVPLASLLGAIALMILTVLVLGAHGVS